MGRLGFDPGDGGRSGGPGAPTIVNQWTGQVSSINYANPCYNNAYFFGTGARRRRCLSMPAPAAPTPATGPRISAALRASPRPASTTSACCTTTVFFRLIGEGGQTLEIGKDFLNSRDRLGFAGDSDLSVGLYGFELGSWNRLEAGVVDLRWSRDEGTTWTPVPTTNLVPGSAVDEPALPLLLVAALAAALAVRRRPAGPIGARAPRPGPGQHARPSAASSDRLPTLQPHRPCADFGSDDWCTVPSCRPGWLFFWSWQRVTADRPELGESRGPLMLAAVLVVPILTLSWVAHNVGIHRRKGPRRKCSHGAAGLRA